MKNDTAYSLLLLALVTAQFIAGLLALIEITLGHYVSACVYTIAVVVSLFTRKLCSGMTW